MSSTRVLKSVALFAVLGGAIANANLLVNGSFEADDASAPPYYVRYTGATNPTAWTQFNNGVDLVHNLYTQLPTILLSAQDGIQFVDMNAGEPGLFGGLYQDVAVTPGQMYHLSLYAGRWAENSAGLLTYSLIDVGTSIPLAVGTISIDNTDGWLEATLDGQATSALLRVQIEAGGDVYQAAPGLDNVSLTAVPEPAALVALLLGAVALRGRR